MLSETAARFPAILIRQYNRPPMSWLAAAIASSTLFVALVMGTFVAVEEPGGLTFLFAWAGGDAVLVAAVAIAVVLTTSRGAALAWARRHALDDVPEVASARWMAPLGALAVPVLGLLPAAPGVGERGAVLAFYCYDLRWWWAAILVGWTLWRLDVVLAGPVASRLTRTTQWSQAARLLWAEILLAVTLVGFVTITTPLSRFTSDLFGDEPRYVRYCETWFQGRGCDVGQNARFSDIPLDAGPHLLRNLSHVADAVVTEAPQLWTDLRGFLAAPAEFQWLRSSGGRNGFVTGKRGAGMYELHQPGWSVWLMPGYLVDRYLLGTDAGHQDEFPLQLVATTTTTLVFYVLSGIVLFRLLRQALALDGLAWAGAAFAMMTFPTSAFAFQLYPEIAAMFAILCGSLYVARCRSESSDGRPRSPLFAAAVGALVGDLPWMHPRFLLVSIVVGGMGISASRRNLRAPFAAAWLMMLAVLGGYNYHITGSWLPNSLYAATDDLQPLVVANIPDNLIGYAFHGGLGLVPNALWLFGAAPGLIVLWRRDRVAAAFVASVVLALAIPAAGHSLDPAGGTPGRFVVAVVPLLVWPVAILVKRFWASTAFRAVTVVLAVLSLDMAVSFNRTFVKDGGRLIDRTVSGWRPDLVFPRLREYFANVGDPQFGVFVGLVVVIAVATAIAWRRDAAWRASDGGRGGRLRAPWAVTSVVGGLLVLTTVGLSGLLDQWTYPRYRIPDAEARNLAAAALVAGDRCRVCFSSRDASLSWNDLANPAGDPRIDVSGVGDRAVVRVDLGSDGGALGFGKVRVNFGDGTVTPSEGVVGVWDTDHTYAAPGTYRVLVQVDGPTGERSTAYSLTLTGADGTP